MLLLEDASLIDTRTLEVHEGTDILIDSGRIIEVAENVTARDADRMSLRGQYILPGLIDAHVHVMAGSIDLAAAAQWPASYAYIRAGRVLEGMLRRGFTTVRDTGGADAGLARAVSDGLVKGPRLAFGGRSFSQTGGHGDLGTEGEHSPHGHGLTRVTDGVEECRKAAREELRLGAHHIKVMLGGGVASTGDQIDSVQFSEEELSAIVREAAAVDRYVTGHAYTSDSVRHGLSAGIRCFEHGNLIDLETLQLMREMEAFLVPTLVTFRALSQQDGLSHDSRQKLAVIQEESIAGLERARLAGVQIAFGSDLLGDCQTQQLEEFAVRSEVLSPAELIASATTTAATLLGMADQIGWIGAGFRADLVGYRRNPIEGIGALIEESGPIFVMKEGEIIVDLSS
jgi:imidazolonepropionase-like amidohydrolase